MLRIHCWTTAFLVFVFSLSLSANDRQWFEYPPRSSTVDIVTNFCEALVSYDIKRAKEYTAKSISLEQLRSMKLMSFKLESKEKAQGDMVKVKLAFKQNQTFKSGTYTFYLKKNKIAFIVAEINVPQNSNKIKNRPGL